MLGRYGIVILAIFASSASAAIARQGFESTSPHPSVTIVGGIDWEMHPVPLRRIDNSIADYAARCRSPWRLPTAGVFRMFMDDQGRLYTDDGHMNSVIQTLDQIADSVSLAGKAAFGNRVYIATTSRVVGGTEESVPRGRVSSELIQPFRVFEYLGEGFVTPQSLDIVDGRPLENSGIAVIGFCVRFVTP